MKPAPMAICSECRSPYIFGEAGTFGPSCSCQGEWHDSTHVRVRFRVSYIAVTKLPNGSRLDHKMALDSDPWRTAAISPDPAGHELRVEILE